MSDNTIGLDRIEEIMTAYKISDEALEVAAGSRQAGNYTLYFCTALDLCQTLRFQTEGWLANATMRGRP